MKLKLKSFFGFYLLFTFAILLMPMTALANEIASEVVETSVPLTATSFSLSSTSYTYDGNVKSPVVTVKNNNGDKLIKDKDYTISYVGERKNVGKYSVKITLKGDYSGEKILYFTIKAAKAKTFSLSSYSYTYNGKVMTPAVTVQNTSGTKLSKDKDFTLNYASGRKNVGKYSVKITLKGNYTGSKTLYFIINPKGTSISNLNSGNKSFTANWKKQTSMTTGYQLQYSESSNFKSSKTVTISGNTKTSRTISSLKTKKKYYVRIRTYKCVNKTNYYSSWSKTCTVTTATSSQKLSLGAKSAVIMRVEDGTVLYNKDMNKKLPNASTTKMMTALLCFENNPMNGVVKFSKNAAKTEDGCLNANVGEKITINNLLNSLLISSSNDSATAIAEYTSGSVGKFATLMNKRAKELGCKNTNFVNPHGLDNSNHYSSAYDLALIQKENIKNPEYLKIIAKKSFKYQNVGKTRTFSGKATDALLGQYSGFLGGKTGYTGKAKYCFCGVYKHNGVTYIYTVLGGSTSKGRWDDCKKIMSYINKL